MEMDANDPILVRHIGLHMRDDDDDDGAHAPSPDGITSKPLFA